MRFSVIPDCRHKGRCSASVEHFNYRISFDIFVRRLLVLNTNKQLMVFLLAIYWAFLLMKESWLILVRKRPKISPYMSESNPI